MADCDWKVWFLKKRIIIICFYTPCSPLLYSLSPGLFNTFSCHKMRKHENTQKEKIGEAQVKKRKIHMHIYTFSSHYILMLVKIFVYACTNHMYITITKINLCGFYACVRVCVSSWATRTGQACCVHIVLVLLVILVKKHGIFWLLWVMGFYLLVMMDIVDKYAKFVWYYENSKYISMIIFTSASPSPNYSVLLFLY